MKRNRKAIDTEKKIKEETDEEKEIRMNNRERRH